jgi:methylated-DNA-[protein]-cysteine S-methyltransferase
MLSFSNKVKQVVAKIPKGQVLTYKQVAQQAGRPKAARAVAKIMANNFDSNIPCHRVVRSDGSIGGYNRGGSQAKRNILISEGVNL